MVARRAEVVWRGGKEVVGNVGFGEGGRTLLDFLGVEVGVHCRENIYSEATARD